jgi:1,4-dihydroxy-2-naphthoyl-CoA hydrolase
MSYYRSIRLADTDAAGVIYFANLLSICHEAYEESLAKAGISLRKFIEEGAIALPIMKAEIQFFQPLFCGDRVEIEISTSSIEETRFELEYTIFRDGDREKPAGVARTRHACINPRTRSKIPFPESLRDWIESL